MRRELLELIKRGAKIGDVIYDQIENIEYYLLAARQKSYCLSFYLININPTKAVVPFHIVVTSHLPINGALMKQHADYSFINGIKLNHQCNGKLLLSVHRIIIRINTNLYYCYSYYGDYKGYHHKKFLEQHAKNNLVTEVVGDLRKTIATNLLCRIKERYICNIESKAINTLKSMIS